MENKAEERVVGGIRDACEWLVKFLNESGAVTTRVENRNLGRHRMITVAVGFRIYKLYLVYQSKPFRMFRRYYGYEGEGEIEAVSINHDILVNVAKEGTYRIFWVLGDGRVFFGDPRTVLHKAIENRWIRRTKRTGELIVNIPIDTLTPCYTRVGGG